MRESPPRINLYFYSVEARRNFRSSPQAALQPYLSLQELANSLKLAQPAAEYAAPHLINHVETTTQQLWGQMKDAFAADFEATLSKMKWPNRNVVLSGSLKGEWLTGVEKLLDLQEPEFKERERMSDSSPKGVQPLVLLPLEVMFKTLELRFIYHFDGDRVTNRLDKPEFFMGHILDLLNSYDDFFAENLHPALQRHFQHSNTGLEPAYINSSFALITAALPVLRRKVFSTLPKVAKEPQLLSHLIHELMKFDDTIRDEWGYDGAFGSDGWRGLTWEVLVSQEWFAKWLKVEKDFAMTRYNNIINARDNWEIDYDSVDPGMTKPTKAAIRVNDLVETITERYQPLASFSQKMRFLIDIQITIFDEFGKRLSSSFEAYLALTSTIGRAVQGGSKEEQSQVQGLGGFERLCRIYGSAEYLEKKMRDWNDDVFFLDLWEELNTRALQKDHPGETVVGLMSIEDVANRTSSSVGVSDETGALFDETAAYFQRLRIRSEGLMQDHLVQSIRESLRPYGRINIWTSLGSEGVDSSSLAITAEMDIVVQQLNTFLSFLSKVLAEAPLHRVCRQLALSLQNFFWDSILMRNTFSRYGSAQAARDVYAIWEVMDRHVGQNQSRLSMRKLAEGLELLNMPLKYGQDVKQDAQPPETENEEILDVEKRMFRDNESARDVLEELNMETLSESEARSLLEKRIELGS